MFEELLIYDYIGWFFWTLTYIVIIFTGTVNLNNKYVGIPVFPVLVNFSWEIASVVNPTTIYRQIWFFFDIFIVALIFKKQNLIKEKKRLLSYLVFMAGCTVAFYFIFKNNDLLLPISSFFIDTAMAIIYLIQRKKIEPANRIVIGVFKFLADAFVWVYHAGFHPSVSFFAAITFVCNIVYIVYAVKEAKEHPEIRLEFKERIKYISSKINKSLRKQKNITHNNKYKKKKNNRKAHRKNK